MKKLLLLFFVLACTGDIGPTGPQGVEGPQGIPGMNASVSWDIVQLDADGFGRITFLNTSIETSVINCYISDRTQGPWIFIAFGGSTDLACAAANIGTNLGVLVVGAIPDWYFLATAAYTP